MIDALDAAAARARSRSDGSTDGASAPPPVSASTPRPSAGSTGAAATGTGGGPERGVSRFGVRRLRRTSRFRIDPQLEIDGFGRAALVVAVNGRPYTYAGRSRSSSLPRPTSPPALDFVAARASHAGECRAADAGAVPGRRRPPLISATISTRSRSVATAAPVAGRRRDLGDCHRGLVRGRARRADGAPLNATHKRRLATGSAGALEDRGR